jgi:selenide,water dikinase
LRNLNQNTNSNFTLGFNSSDDAAAYEIENGKIILQSLDFFTPIIDDPYEFGKIAAVNSLSDIYAMGGKPLFGLNIVAFPEDTLPIEILSDIMQGAQNIADQVGIPILGGHSIKDKEIKYGMSITGEVDKFNLKRNDTAKPGDCLVLTKPLGTGIISTAIKQNQASNELFVQASRVMTTLNKNASEAMIGFKVNACTDITGYGLLGHLLEMCIGSNVSSEIYYNDIPFIDGVEELAKNNIIPGGTKKNLAYVKPYINSGNIITEINKLMLADAQTSGGLLISVDQSDCKEIIKKINSNNNLSAKCIGIIREKSTNSIYIK